MRDTASFTDASSLIVIIGELIISFKVVLNGSLFSATTLYRMSLSVTIPVGSARPSAPFLELTRTDEIPFSFIILVASETLVSSSNRV